MYVFHAFFCRDQRNKYTQINRMTNAIQIHWKKKQFTSKSNSLMETINVYITKQNSRNRNDENEMLQWHSVRGMFLFNQMSKNMGFSYEDNDVNINTF